MVMVLEQDMVDEIGRIGRLRAPAEACGLLLPYPVNGKQVMELPNRAKKSHDTFCAKGDDIILVLEELYGDDITRDVLDQMVIWHTHPRGNLGPSKYDLEHRPRHFKSLVVTLNEDETQLATWF